MTTTTVTTKKISTRNMVLCAMFSALIAVGAFIKIPLPLVPVTLQMLFANLAGLILGKRNAAISVGVYILLGLIGLPVFTGGGGISYILHPTFGYLIGFLFGAWTSGFVVEKSKSKGLKTMMIASLANMCVVYTFGLTYYYFIANYYMNSPIGVGALMLNCFLVFLPSDLVFCMIASILAKRLYPIVLKGGMA